MKRIQRRLSPMPWLAGSVLGLSAVLPLAASAAESPYTMPDEAWISIDGTVEAVSPDSFELDYGDGMVTVEMDDGDRDADAKVSSVGGGELGLQMGGSELTVRTESLGYDPLDDKGYQKVEVGDRVSVTGDMDAQFFGGPLLKADSIIVLQDARSDGNGQS